MKLTDVPAHWRITAICLRCSHCAPLPVGHLVSTRQVGPRTTAADLEEGRMLRCARCESRKVKVKIETDDDPITPRRARRRSVEGGADGMDALTQMFCAEVERALRRRLACYAPLVEFDWSEGVGAAGPRGLAAITYRGEVLDADGERLFDRAHDCIPRIASRIDHYE